MCDDVSILACLEQLARSNDVCLHILQLKGTSRRYSSQTFVLVECLEVVMMRLLGTEYVCNFCELISQVLSTLRCNDG